MVSGVPEPTLTWTRDGKRYPVLGDGSLVLKEVGLDDEGTYTCTATNTAGNDQAQVQLLVQGWSGADITQSSLHFSGLNLVSELKAHVCTFV